MGFDYRDRLSSEMLNRKIAPIDQQVQNLLDIFDTVLSYNQDQEIVSSIINDEYSSLRSAIIALGNSTTFNNTVKTAISLPEISSNITIYGGTFTLDSEISNCVPSLRHGEFNVGVASVKINNENLIDSELVKFNKCLQEGANFLKDVGSNTVNTIEIGFKSSYPVNFIRISSALSNTNRVELISPFCTKRFNNCFFFDNAISGVTGIKFTIPSINRDGTKYLYLSNISILYSIPQAYGEMVFPINVTGFASPILTNLNAEGSYNRNQIRLVIDDSTTLVTEREPGEVVSTVYDSSNDQYPLIDGLVTMPTANNYLHVILYNSVGSIPFIKRIAWKIE